MAHRPYVSRVNTGNGKAENVTIRKRLSSRSIRPVNKNQLNNHDLLMDEKKGRSWGELYPTTWTSSPKWIRRGRTWLSHLPTPLPVDQWMGWTHPLLADVREGHRVNRGWHCYPLLLRQVLAWVILTAFCPAWRVLSPDSESPMLSDRYRTRHWVFCILLSPRHWIHWNPRGLETPLRHKGQVHRGTRVSRSRMRPRHPDASGASASSPPLTPASWATAAALMRKWMHR